MMEVIQTEDTSFVRDLHSKALINTDRVALENHRKRKQIEIQQAKRWQQMEIKLEELNNVRNEVLEIKDLLQELLNKKEL
jgi:hypothetical protein|tara:strand:+ start:72 stop:311 length:240 start_codon:yes stop_codon:yes gene_type:complete